ncbi:flagellar filament capping protein FliD [Algiphilus aromaticivorans]|uniref:flagellar filament capping protein FliD n=1 Tax=Algiphilus aromaticivorans TaxID=382454 RepID=UPI0005C1E19F|nr:flagellar filament capping protein FliD [Algiphilus aromaticivorans]
MATTFAGIGSGLDLESMVTQLVQAERQGPIQRINRVEARANQENKAFDAVNSSMSALQNAAKALEDAVAGRAMKAVVPEGAAFSITAGASAAESTFDVEVEAIAGAQKLRSTALDAETSLGNGTLTLSLGGESFDVAVAAGEGTPAEIARAINDAGDNPGIRASVINGSNGAYLVLAAEETGAANTMTVTASGGDGGLAALQYTGDPVTDGLEQIAAARDAVIHVDGVQLNSATNSFVDVLDGVSIDVSSAAPGETVATMVTRDDDALAGAVAAFVKAYNDSRELMAGQTRYNPESGSAGPLQGDAAARGLTSALRDMRNVTGAEGSELQALVQLGISSDTSGKLSFDRSAFDTALADDPEGVAALLGGQGLAGRADSRLSGYLGSDGLIASRKEALDSRLERASSDREALDRRLEQVERRLRSQFAALDTLMAQMQQDSNFLAQQLGSTGF